MAGKSYRFGSLLCESRARAWELLIGSCLAVWLHRVSPINTPWVRDAAGWLGIAFLATSIIMLQERMLFPGLAALLPCLGTLSLIWSGSLGVGPVQKLLATSPLVWVGKLSYSLYLWHWPVLVLVNSAGWYGHGLPHVPLYLQLAAMFLLAWLSWRFVEQPFRNGRIGWGSRRVLTVSIATLAVIYFCGTVAKEIAQNSFPLKMPTPQLVFQLQNDMRTTPGIRCEGSDDPTVIRQNGGGCLVGTGASAPRFALMGDSHARMYTDGLDILSRERHGRVLIMARSSCVPALAIEPPTRSECLELTKASFDFLANSNISLVVLAGYWIDLASDDDRALLLLQGIESAIVKLRASGKQVVLLMDVPELDDDRQAYRAALQSLRQGGLPVFGLTLSEHKKNQSRINYLLQDIARKYELMTLDPADLMCGVSGCLIADQGRAMYRDRHHITDDAAIYYRYLFSPLFK